MAIFWKTQLLNRFDIFNNGIFFTKKGKKNFTTLPKSNGDISHNLSERLFSKIHLGKIDVEIVKAKGRLIMEEIIFLEANA